MGNIPKHEGNSRHSVIVPYRLGVLLDRDDQAHRDMVDAMHLGISEFRVTGALDRDVELIVRQIDGAPWGSTLDIVAEWETLFREEPILGMIGPFGDANGAAVSQHIEHGALTTITTSADDRFTGRYVFQFTLEHSVDIAHLLLRHARARNCARPVLLRDPGPGGALIDAAYRRAASQDGWSHVDVVERNDRLGETLARAAALGWDALLYFGGVAHSAVNAAIEAAGWSPTCLTGLEIDRAHAVYGDASSLEGWTGLAGTHSGNSQFKAFRRSFQEAYRRDGGHLRAAQGYDIGRMIGRVCVDIRPPSAEGLRDGLDRVRMMLTATGAPGTVASFTRYDRRGLKNNPLTFATVKGGVPHYLSEDCSQDA